MTLQLRWYQSEACQALVDYYSKTPSVDDAGNIRRRNPLVLLPTGTGKSLVIAAWCDYIIKNYPHMRMLMLTHTKELIKQNADELQDYWTHAPLGIVSAGLKRSQYGYPITFAGIGSVHNHVGKLGKIDFVIVDEAHMISPKGETRYQALLASLYAINPYMTVIGLTATGYRLGIGDLTANGIFTDIAYDACSFEKFNALVNDGYLSPLVTRMTETKLDTSGVKVQGGEFNMAELQNAVDKKDVTIAAMRELIWLGQDRHSWLIFSAGVEHAEHIVAILQGFNVPAAAVHGNMPDTQRDEYIRAFKNYELRALVNNNLLTTGFNHPGVDLIGMLRPTKSTSLWVQMLGRGTRPSPQTGKVNCLCLDYAGNTESLGPINDPVKPKRKAKGSGEAPVWCCSQCSYYNHARAPFCIACGAMHDISSNRHRDNASNAEVMRSDTKVIETFNVNRVLYYPFEKDGRAPSMRVDYVCGVKSFKEWVNFENPRSSYFVAKWWYERSAENVPATTNEALQYAREGQLKEPVRIRVCTNTHYPTVEGVEFS